MLSAASMKSKIEAHMSAAGAVQTNDAGVAMSYRDSMLLAMCQGIVDEIQQNAVVQGVTAGGDTGTVE